MDPDDDALAADLRYASEGVQSLPCDPAERARWHARLIAITHAAKRDSARAQRRLARFLLDLEARAKAGNKGSR